MALKKYPKQTDPKKKQTQKNPQTKSEGTQSANLIFCGWLSF